MKFIKKNNSLLNGKIEEHLCSKKNNGLIITKSVNNYVNKGGN